MFGLEGQKGKKGKPNVKDFTFDLEAKLKNGSEMKALKDKVHANLQKLKHKLQEGIEGEEFENVGHLVYGYIALLKVTGKIPTGKS